MAPWGEKATPASNDITDSIIRVHSRYNETELFLTSFGKVESFFEEVGDQTKERNETTQGGAYNVEVGDCQSRHLKCMRSTQLVLFSCNADGRTSREDLWLPGAKHCGA